MRKLDKDLIERIRRMPAVKFGVGANAQEVREAELALSLDFPKSFKRYLEGLGWLAVGSREIFGLGQDVPKYLHLVEMTRSERGDVYPAMPPPLIPVYNDGGGNHYCLDTSATLAGECPVVFWDHDLGPDQKPDFIASDFAVWLGSIVSNSSGDSND